MSPKASWTAPTAVRRLDRSLAFKLLQARELVMQRFRPHLRQYDLTEQQWRVLRALAEFGPREMRDLSERCCILPPSLSRTVPMLEARGLVARQTVDSDQRRIEVSLTDDGRTLFNIAAGESERIYAEMGDALGKDTLAATLELLDTVITRLGTGKADG
ncbi:MAG TPA: homoprotocatechuate degradation operon regulator HpaR [Acidiphilium sp.]